MPEVREKFATQVDADILAQVRALAKNEGRQIQALVDEALLDLIEKHKKTRPRPHVMATYQSSHGRFADLYEKLAK
jgi:arsenate reductase-like glutaredoxin family protein